MTSWQNDVAAYLNASLFESGNIMWKENQIKSLQLVTVNSPFQNRSIKYCGIFTVQTFPPIFSRPYLPANIFLPIPSCQYFSANIFLPILSRQYFPANTFPPIFSHQYFPTNIYLPIFSLQYFPANIFQPIFSSQNLSVNIFPLKLIRQYFSRQKLNHHNFRSKMFFAKLLPPKKV